MSTPEGEGGGGEEEEEEEEEGSKLGDVQYEPRTCMAET